MIPHSKFQKRKPIYKILLFLLSLLLFLPSISAQNSSIDEEINSPLGYSSLDESKSISKPLGASNGLGDSQNTSPDLLDESLEENFQLLNLSPSSTVSSQYFTVTDRGERIAITYYSKKVTFGVGNNMPSYLPSGLKNFYEPQPFWAEYPTKIQIKWDEGYNMSQDPTFKFYQPNSSNTSWVATSNPNFFSTTKTNNMVEINFNTSKFNSLSAPFRFDVTVYGKKWFSQYEGSFANVINLETITPSIEFENSQTPKNIDPERIIINIKKHLSSNNNNQPKMEWVITGNNVNLTGNTQEELDLARNTLEIGKYNIKLTGWVDSSYGYEIRRSVAENFSITIEPKYTVDLALDLSGGFQRNGKYYNPTHLISSEQTSGTKSPQTLYRLNLINYDNNSSTIISETPVIQENTVISDIFNTLGLNNLSLGLNLQVVDNNQDIIAESTVDLTLFESKPVIDLDRLFNLKNADIKNIYFSDSPDDYYHWKVSSESGEIKAEDNTKNIPTNIFASLLSETDTSTKYKIEFTEKYTEGFSDSAEPVYISVKRPQPSFSVDGVVTPADIENPSVIDIIPDSLIDNLNDPDDISQYSWEITSSKLPSPITGNGKQIPNEKLSVLDSGEYSVTASQTFMPYANGFENGTGSVSFTFSVKENASFSVAKHIDFGKHKIEDKMTIPWEKVDGKTGSDFTNGKVPLAEIKAGAIPITGVRLSSTPITNVNDSNNKIVGTMHWGELNKSNQHLERKSLEGNGCYIVDKNVGIAPGATETVYCTDDSSSLNGIYFMTESGNVPDLLASEYSATLTWTIEYTP